MIHDACEVINTFTDLSGNVNAMNVITSAYTTWDEPPKQHNHIQVKDLQTTHRINLCTFVLLVFSSNKGIKSNLNIYLAHTIKKTTFRWPYFTFVPISLSIYLCTLKTSKTMQILHALFFILLIVLTFCFSNVITSIHGNGSYCRT
jgi:hypothetical protein